MSKQIDIAENVIRGLLKGGIRIDEFTIAINNAFCHGEILIETNHLLDDDDILLGELFEGIEKINSAANKIVNYDGGDVIKKSKVKVKKK